MIDLILLPFFVAHHRHGFVKNQKQMLVFRKPYKMQLHDPNMLQITIKCSQVDKYHKCSHITWGGGLEFLIWIVSTPQRGPSKLLSYQLRTTCIACLNFHTEIRKLNCFIITLDFYLSFIIL